MPGMLGEMHGTVRLWAFHVLNHFAKRICDTDGHEPSPLSGQ